MEESTYENLLKRLQSKTLGQDKKGTSRIELPRPDIIWVGNKTIFRNFADFPKFMRRDPEKVLLYLAKEFGSAAYIAGEKGIFVGKKTPSTVTWEIVNKFVLQLEEICFEAPEKLFIEAVKQVKWGSRERIVTPMSRAERHRV